MGMSSPSISVIVTVKNDVQNLQVLLKDLAAQTLSPEHVLLAVAESEDETLSLATSHAARDSKYRVISVGLATRAQGRNLAIQESQDDILVFTDVGCRLTSEWLEQLTFPFSESSIVLTSGLTLGDPKTPFEKAQVPFVLVGAFEQGEHPLPATRNMAVRRQAFLAVGLFEPDLNTAEDFEWSRRAASKGVVSIFVPSAVVRWRPRSSAKAFWSMIFRLTQGDIQAGTWRRGHVTMMLRYVIFFFLLLVWWPLGVLVWSFYIVSKSGWLAQKHKTPLLETVLCQILVDSAVWSGILSRMGRK